MRLGEASQGPPVSVVLTVGPGQGDARAALRSVLGQTRGDLEVIVAGDYDEALIGLPESRDSRVRLLRPRPGRPRGAVLTEALGYAGGRYVCYLRAADVYYPDHVRMLVEALDTGRDCGAAYSDVYTTVFRPGPGGRRVVLGKVLRGRRDFSRFYLLGCDYIRPTGLIHRRDLLARTGPPNDSLDALADWDLHRRLAFFTDFLHVSQVTAEQYAPQKTAEDADSAEPDGPEQAPHRELSAVLSARPAKPWPKMPDLAIVLAPERSDARMLAAIDELRRRTAVPHRLHVAAASGEELAPGERVPVGSGWPWDARVDKALRACSADCIALPGPGLPPSAEAVERAMFVLIHHAGDGEAVRLGQSAGGYGGVFRAEQLLDARRRHPALSVRRSLEAERIVLTPALPEQSLLAFDADLRLGAAAEAEGNFLQAADFYRQAGRKGNSLWMAEAAVGALHRHGQHDGRALDACRQINAESPTVASLLLEARLLREDHQLDRACRRLEQAREILDWTPAPLVAAGIG